MKRTQKQTKPKTTKRPNNNKPKQQQEGQNEPYPNHPRPTHEECLAIRDTLLSLQGFPPEFVRYRQKRLMKRGNDDVEEPQALDDEEESVLDGLVRNLLSQNTSEGNSLRAFSNLKAAFPTWEKVLAAESKCVEDAIRCGGLAPTKASCIKNILNGLLQKKGKLCLEYLRDLSVDEVKAELSQFKGIGPKTVACVLMFTLQHDDLPVDTHVFEIARTIGWVPNEADRNKTYIHLNRRIPNELKFDLNCLLYTHGKLCRKCSKRGANQRAIDSSDDSCPLLHYTCFNRNCLEKTS